MNISKEGEFKQLEIPKKAERKNIAITIKAEFGEMVTYNKEENTIYCLDNQYLTHLVIMKLLTEYKIYYQPNLF